MGEFDRELRAATPGLDLWLDTSEQTPDQTVATILARFHETLVT